MSDSFKIGSRIMTTVPIADIPAGASGKIFDIIDQAPKKFQLIFPSGRTVIAVQGSFKMRDVEERSDKEIRIDIEVGEHKVRFIIDPRAFEKAVNPAAFLEDRLRDMAGKALKAALGDVQEPREQISKLVRRRNAMYGWLQMKFPNWQQEFEWYCRESGITLEA